MKGYSAFPKAPVLLEPHDQIFSVVYGTLVVEVLPLCRDAVWCILETQENKFIVYSAFVSVWYKAFKLLTIIIKVYLQHKFPSLSLSLFLSLSLTHTHTHTHTTLFLISPLGNTQYAHRAEECKFLLVSQHWCVYALLSIGERRL